MPARLDHLWDDIRDELRRETRTSSSTSGSSRSSWPGVHGKTLYVRAPEHIRTSVAERYLPLLRRAAASASTRTRSSRSSGRPGPRRRPTAAAGRGPSRPGRGARLNPKYSFEQFVIGEGNRFAHAASLAVAELPAQAYNPLFLHGRPGLGKTHLLHAIGNYVQRYGAGLRVRYATIEEFTTGFVDAVRAAAPATSRTTSAARTSC